MADDSLQTGTDTIATDHVTLLNGVASTVPKVQRVKVGYGDDGTHRDTSTAYPLPVLTPGTYTTGTISAANANLQTGTATASSSVALTVPDGHSSWTVYLSGTWVAGTTLHFQGSPDNVNWHALNGRRNADINSNDTTTLLSADPVGGAAPAGGNPSNWRGSLGGIRYFRVTCAPYTASDSIAVQIVTSAAPGAVFQNAATPAGGNIIGATRGTGSTLIAVSRITPTTTAATLAVARTNRNRVIITNNSNQTVFVGPATVTAANGYPVGVGYTLTLQTIALVQCIIASGTATADVAVVEEYES